MNKRHTIFLTAIISFLVLVTGVLAQGTPAIGRWVIGSGGGETSGAGEVAVNSTLGQPIIGSSDGGSLSLGAGYWYGGMEVEYEIHLPLVLK